MTRIDWISIRLVPNCWRCPFILLNELCCLLVCWWVLFPLRGIAAAEITRSAKCFIIISVDGLLNSSAGPVQSRNRRRYGNLANYSKLRRLRKQLQTIKDNCESRRDASLTLSSWNIKFIPCLSFFYSIPPEEFLLMHLGVVLFVRGAFVHQRDVSYNFGGSGQISFLFPENSKLFFVPCLIKCLPL